MRSAHLTILSRTFVAVFVLLILAPSRQAQANPAPAIEFLAVLEDPTMSLTIDDVLSEQYASKFVSVTPPCRYKNNDVAYWFKIKVIYPQGDSSEDWALDLNWDILRGIVAYFPFNAGANSIDNGDSSLHLNSSFLLPSPKQEQNIVYIRLIGYVGLNINPEIKSVTALDRGIELRTWLFGMMFGLMFAMFIYNLFLLFSLRDVSYFWYVLHILLLGLYYYIFNGLDFFLEPTVSKSDFIQKYTVFMVISAFMFFSMGMFARNFLLIREKHPVLKRLLLAQGATCAVFLGLVAFFGPASAMNFAPVVAATTSITIVIVGATRFLQGFKPAGVFLVGWSFYVTCGIIHSLTVAAGLLPPSPVTINAVEVGSSVEVMVMALALAYRVKLLREEKELSERARERLAQENTLQSIILENSQLGIGFVQEGSVIRSNHQFRAMTGQEEGSEIISLDVIPGFPDLLGSHPDDGGSGLVEKVAEVGADENRRILRALGKTVNPASPRAGVVWVVEDITERTQLEYLKANIERIMHHDLRSPLALIAGLHEALAMSGSLNEAQERFSKMIGKAASRGLDQLAALLAIYKMESGSYSGDFQPVDLIKTIEEVVAELAPYTNSGQMAVKTVLGPGVTPDGIFAFGDPILMQTVLINLIRNALEAMPGPGETILTVSLESQLRLDITNPGEVPVNIRDKFFEKYATAGKKKGTGLGTYSARLIALQFGGDVELDCSQPGQTTVTVRLIKADPPL